VAIADRQTAIYPAVSPGGWNLIGRCPVRMFDPDSQPSMPVAVGDRVRFETVNRERFLARGGELSGACRSHSPAYSACCRIPAGAANTGSDSPTADRWIARLSISAIAC